MEAKFRIEELLGVGLTLVVLGVGLSYGLEVMGDVQDDMTAANGTWAVVRSVPASAAEDAVLEAGERFTLSVSLPDGETVAPGGEFTLSLSAPGAVTFDLRRQVPAKVDAVTVL